MPIEKKNHIPIRLIAAVASNNVIGHELALPWRLKSDLKHFRESTLGRPIIMGHKTFLSLGKPLPKRTNIVLSRQLQVAPEGTYLAKSLDEALTLGQHHAHNHETNDPALLVIGGGEIYRLFWSLADELIITHVDANVEGDTTFPTIGSEWEKTSSQTYSATEGDDHAFHVAHYQRLKPR